MIIVLPIFNYDDEVYANTAIRSESIRLIKEATPSDYETFPDMGCNVVTDQYDHEDEEYTTLVTSAKFDDVVDALAASDSCIIYTKLKAPNAQWTHF